MRVLLEVHSGVMAGRRTWVEPGKALEVGRMEYSDFVFPQDPQMSGRHFALECASDSCVIRDLRSSNGTFVNNERIESASLRDGDEILAGQTVFTVRFENEPVVAPTMTPTATGLDSVEKPTLHSALLLQAASEKSWPGADARPPAFDDEKVAPVTPRAEAVPHQRPRVGGTPEGVAVDATAPDRAADRATPAARPPAVVKAVLKEPYEWPVDIRNFRPEPGNYTYAVIDAAAAPELIGHARQLGMDLRCLLPDAPEPLARVAPYVVQITSKSNFFHYWADSRGKNAGILLESPERLEAVFDHCRRVFLSHTDDGQNCFFRFYDPRVLRPYLPTCTLEELTQFFGATHAVLVDDEQPDKLLRYMSSNAGLRLQLLKVDSAGETPLPTQVAY